MLTHIAFGEGKKTVAVLIPTKDMKSPMLIEHYINPLVALGIPKEEILALNLDQNEKDKSPVKTVVQPCLARIAKALKYTQVKYLLICDPVYFKSICKVTKTEFQHGYAVPTIWPNITGFLCPNYRILFYNPALQDRINISLKALANAATGKDNPFQLNVTRQCEFPTTIQDIKDALHKLLKAPAVTCDIETYSLKLNEAGLATISFAINEKFGYAFPVGDDKLIREVLKEFFTEYSGKVIYHGSTFDTKVLIWALFMEHPRDYRNMLKGLHILHKNLEDTKLLAYLALNSTAGISLKLKELAFEFAGKYALDDIGNIRLKALGEILDYNMTDALATWYVYNKYHSQVMQEQKDIYEKLLLPALKTITQMELCGMPMNLGKVLNTEHQMDDISQQHYKAIMSDPIIIAFEEVLREHQAEKANSKLKKLRKTKDDFLGFQFNPGSNVQLAHLLFEYLQLPILETTDSGAPSTKSDVLRNLIIRIRNSKKLDQSYIPLLEHLIELSEVSKILTTFIPAFKNNSISKSGWQYLHGSFNLGGTKSGRQSSSDPNLTNIPSTGTKYAKPIKKCFQAPIQATKEDPTGWLMVGADYSSLEDRVSALLTKDPNKLDIYIKGYDGHCLRAYAYFGDRMTGIDPNDVTSINSIATRYPDLRQLSKSPTFLLTYFGTWKGLVKTFGFTEEAAKQIEENYHKLYAVSDQWVKDRIKEAQKTGYVELAFGLRLRTPMLPQVLLDSDTLPYPVHKEIKTAGNALGQSYGLLNTHSANLFMQKVWKSRYAHSVMPIAQIHDSQYYMIRNTLNCLKWVNDNLIKCMEWNELEPIQHPVVKLQANLEVYYPDWSSPIAIPNRISVDNLEKHLKRELRKLHKKQE